MVRRLTFASLLLLLLAAATACKKKSNRDQPPDPPPSQRAVVNKIYHLLPVDDDRAVVLGELNKQPKVLLFEHGKGVKWRVTTPDLAPSTELATDGSYVSLAESNNAGDRRNSIILTLALADGTTASLVSEGLLFNQPADPFAPTRAQAGKFFQFYEEGKVNIMLALDMASGEVAWTHRLEGGDHDRFSWPIFTPELILAVRQSRWVAASWIAIDPDDGQEVWRSNSTKVHITGCLVGGQLYYSDPLQLMAFDLTSQKERVVTSDGEFDRRRLVNCTEYRGDILLFEIDAKAQASYLTRMTAAGDKVWSISLAGWWPLFVNRLGWVQIEKITTRFLPIVAEHVSDATNLTRETRIQLIDLEQPGRRFESAPLPRGSSHWGVVPLAGGYVVFLRPELTIGWIDGESGELTAALAYPKAGLPFEALGLATAANAVWVWHEYGPEFTALAAGLQPLEGATVGNRMTDALADFRELLDLHPVGD